MKSELKMIFAKVTKCYFSLQVDIECFRSGHYGPRTKMHIVPHCVRLKKGNNRERAPVLHGQFIFEDILKLVKT